MSITREKSIADKYALVATRSLGSLYLRPGDATPTASHYGVYTAFRKAKSEEREFRERESNYAARTVGILID